MNQKVLSKDKDQAAPPGSPAETVRCPAAAGGRADRHPDAQHGAVPGRDLADHRRPRHVGRRRAGSGAHREEGGLPAAARPADQRGQAGGPLLGRHRRPGGALHHRRRGHASPRGAGPEPLPRARVPARLAVPGRARPADRAKRRDEPRARGALPAAQGAGGRGDHATAQRARGADGGRAGHDLAGAARRHGREPARHQERGQAGPARDLRPEAAPRQGARALERARRRAAHLQGDRRQDQEGVRRAPARARAARADAPDPEGAGRGRGHRRRARRAEEGHRRRRHARGRAQACGEGAEAPAAHGRGQRRRLDASDLPGVAVRVAVEGCSGSRNRYCKSKADS